MARREDFVERRAEGGGVGGHVGRGADRSGIIYQRFGTETLWLGLLDPWILLEAPKVNMGGGLRLQRPEGTANRMPAEFFVDEQGVIRESFYASHLAEHFRWSG